MFLKSFMLFNLALWALSASDPRQPDKEKEKETAAVVEVHVAVEPDDKPSGEAGDAPAADPNAPARRRMMKFIAGQADGDRTEEEASAAGDGQDAERPRKVVRIKQVIKDANIEAGGPWLGVKFGPVPRPTAAQLGLAEDVGQMVLDVITGSPADSAELKQFDILTAVDDKPVPAGITEFLDQVRELTPGRSYSFSLLRDGQKMEVPVTLGQRPEADKMGESKFGFLDDGEDVLHGRVFGRGGLLEKDDQGRWTMKSFDMEELPDIWKMFPDDDFHFEFQMPDAMDENVFIFKNQQGRSVRVEQDADGKVTVTTTEKQNDEEKKSTATYDSMEDFKQADPETYKLTQEDRPPGFGDMDSDMHMFMHRLPVPGPEMERMHERMSRLHEQMRQMNEKMEQMQSGREDDRIQELQEELNRMQSLFDDDLGGQAAAAPFHWHSRPQTRFERSPDGQIQVITRNGPDELTEVFKDLDQLRDQRPQLFEKYQRLQRGGGASTAP